MAGDPAAEPADGYYCALCDGMGGWELSGEEVDFGDPEDVDCSCCGGNGRHHGRPGPCTDPPSKTEAPRAR